jgi:hypothetical protein
MPLIPKEDLSLSLNHINFMFPVVGVPGGMAAGFNVKSSHAEIGSPIRFSDEYPAGDAFDQVVVYFGFLDISIVRGFHFISFRAAPFGRG